MMQYHYFSIFFVRGLWELGYQDRCVTLSGLMTSEELLELTFSLENLRSGLADGEVEETCILHVNLSITGIVTVVEGFIVETTI